MATRHAKRFVGTGFRLLLREFGEPVVYFAGGVGGGLPIQAIVERDVEVPSESGDQVSLATIIRVLNSPTEGISAATINDGTDDISVALVPDGSLSRRRISRTIDDANGVVRFLVR
jgi:hypothetical protein